MESGSNQIQKDNELLIRRFYDAFARLDFQAMRQCYASDALFNDPVFGLLQGNEVGAMWEMLCRQARDFQLSYSNIQLLDDEYATCDWVAGYRFSKSGRKVVNRIRAHMRIQQGLITEHTDAFRFYAWSRQALGITGWLLGWSHFMQRRVSRQARANLARFMDQSQTGS